MQQCAFWLHQETNNAKVQRDNATKAHFGLQRCAQTYVFEVSALKEY
jgi:hypothetical protein